MTCDSMDEAFKFKLIAAYDIAVCFLGGYEPDRSMESEK
jgi:hypothetical protein